MFRKLIGAAVLVLALVATLGSADDEGGTGDAASSGDDTETTAASGDGSTGENGGDGGQGAASAGEADEVDDVTISACGKDDVLGFAEATIEVLNDSSEPSNYIIEIVFESADGTRQIGTGTAFINGLSPNQSKTEEVNSLEEAGDEEITCRVSSVDRMAA